jgi:signal transduction histidine kinase
MTLRLADPRRAVDQTPRRGAITTLAAIAIVAVMTLAALGIAQRRADDERLTTQTFATGIATAQAILDRDRELLNRMADAATAGLSDGSALPALPPDLSAAALFDPAGAPLANVSSGLDDSTLAALGDAVARAVAFHPGASLVVIPATDDSGNVPAAFAQPWIGADGFSGGIAVVAFNPAGLAALDQSVAGRFDIVTTDGTPLFAATAKQGPTGARLEAIPGTPLMLRFQPRLDHAEQMSRAIPFALIALLALAATLGLAIILIRRDRAARIKIARAAAVERKLRDELTATAASAERTDEVNRTKSHFLAQVTHELRTPLNAILGFSETIRQEMFGPLTNKRYLEYAGLIHDAGSHLLSLINDLLDNARVEAGKMEIAPIRVSAAAVARSALDLVELLAEEHKVTLAATGLDACPDLNVDPRAIKQVLVNLLSNAIKYTRAGGKIEIRFAVRTEGGVAIEVADTGTGMSAEDVLYAFEPFGRAGADQLRRQPGTGLGLSLARALVRLHGGDLTLASRLDAGTTATVTLPASATFGATQAPAKSEASAPSARAA